MFKKLPFLLAALFVSFALHADHLSDILQMTARLSGNDEVPVVTTDAQGIAIFTLDGRKNTLSIDGQCGGPEWSDHGHPRTRSTCR